MKKSVFTFGLLASSLVMLAIMPVLNQQNLFSNTVAMAQGYDAGYYGDSSYYSQYPTDDKKYECRTGPFEGFFVGSVEFCKFNKFDKDDKRKDIRDNRTGIQGPAGPQGPAGTQGPAGPAGSGNNNSTLVNTFNCINTNNININTDNNSSSSSSSGLQPIQDAIVQGLNGTLDGLSLNKTIVNLCVIIDNDNITIVDGGNETDGNGNGPDTCQGCFDELSLVLQGAIDTFLNNTGAIPVGGGVTIPGDVDNIVELCLFLDALPTPLALTEAQIQALITAFLSAIPGPAPIGAQAELEALIDCLIDADVLVVVTVGGG